MPGITERHIYFMRKIILVLAILCNCSLVNSQHPLVKQWDKRFGGSANDWLTLIQETADHGFIAGGTSASGVSGDISSPSNGSKDFWLVKTDSAGNLLWEKNYGGTHDEEMAAVVQTSDGGYLLAGSSRSQVSGDVTVAGYGMADFWIVKTDSAGNKQWDSRFGGSATDELACAAAVPGGGFLLAGTSASGVSGTKTQASQGFEDYWMVKTDQSGNLIWDQRFGGDQRDQLFALKISASGDIILGGNSNSDISGDKTENKRGLQDYWLVKTNASGTKIWDRRYGGTDDDTFGALEITPDGGYIFGGFSASGVGGDKTLPLKGLMDLWVIKTDASGVIAWDRDYGGSAHDEFIGSISLTSDSGYLIASTTYSNTGGDKSEDNLSVEQMWILKTDSTGLIIWDKTLQNIAGFDDEVAFALQASDGGFVFANYTFAGAGGDKTEPSWGSCDYWLIKYVDTTGIGIAPAVNLTVTDSVFCGKQCVDFTDLSTNSPVSWYWSFPGAVPSSSTDQHPVNICYNAYGQFDVTLVACNLAGCDSLVLQSFITEHPDPVVPTITQNGNVLVSGAAFSYAWYESSQPSVVLSTDSFFMPPGPGSFYVVVCDSAGCCASSALHVIAGLNAVENHAGFSIAYVPSAGVLVTTDRIYEGEVTVHIFSAAGESVTRVTETNIREKFSRLIDTAKLATGIYVVEISTATGKVFSKKVWIGE